MFEVNLISFVPLISGSYRLKKIVLLYFFVQRIGSLLVLSCGVVGLGYAYAGLLLKARIAPFHF